MIFCILITIHLIFCIEYLLLAGFVTYLLVVCIHSPREEQPRVEVDSQRLNKVESESESKPHSISCP